MTIESRIHKIEKEVQDIIHTPSQNWIKGVVKSVKLRILNKKLRELKKVQHKS